MSIWEAPRTFPILYRINNIGLVWVAHGQFTLYFQSIHNLYHCQKEVLERRMYIEECHSLSLKSIIRVSWHTQLTCLQMLNNVYIDAKTLVFFSYCKILPFVLFVKPCHCFFHSFSHIEVIPVINYTPSWAGLWWTLKWLPSAGLLSEDNDINRGMFRMILSQSHIRYG